MAGTSSIKKIVDFIWGEQEDSQEEYDENVYSSDYAEEYESEEESEGETLSIFKRKIYMV